MTEAGTTTTAAPTGITPSVTATASNAATVTMTATAAQKGTYYFKITIDGAASTVATLTVSTPTASLPILTTYNAGSITAAGATFYAYVDNAGTPAYTERGFCYSTAPNPTVADSKITVAGTGTDTFSEAVTGLNGGTTYYVRAWAVNAAGVAYGNEISFTTISLGTLATLTTSTPTAITATGATLGGFITNVGDPEYTLRGVCLATTQNPVYTDGQIVITGSGTGSFSGQKTELIPGTTYYVRAWAYNLTGFAYGEQVSFKTEEGTPPTLTTLTTDVVLTTLASFGGNITDMGTPAYTEKGICWATTSNPTVADNKAAINTGGTGFFYCSANGLTPGTTYYGRAYAVNTAGVAYGNEISFTTLPLETLATLTTSTPTAITATEATLGGNITNVGNPEYIRRGVCLATTQNPVVTDRQIEITGLGTGSFSGQMIGLLPGTTYYVRAFAINKVGVAYGNEISFTTTTSGTVPAAPTNITATAASQTAVNLSWNAVTGATGYKVEYSHNGTSGWTEAASAVTATTYQCGGFLSGFMYFFRVRAYNASGNGPYSAIVSAATLSEGTLPAAPTGLTATVASTTQINLSWTDNANNETAYKVERSTDNSTWTVLSAALAANTAGYSSTGLAAGTRYYYRVSAINATGSSGYSNVAYAATPAALGTPALSGPDSASGSFQLSCSFNWTTPMFSTDHYELEVSYSSGSGYSWLASSPNGTRTSPQTFTVTTEAIDAGKTLYFRVRAQTSAGYTPYSNVVAVSVPATKAPISVYPTRTNRLINNPADPSTRTTSYPNYAPAVGTTWNWSIVGGSALAFRHALWFNLGSGNTNISGQSIKKAELRLYPSTLAADRNTTYSVGAVTSSWGTGITFAQSENMQVHSTSVVNKAPPSTAAVAWVVDVTTTVQNWANGTWANNGFMLYDNTSAYPGNTVLRITEFVGIEGGQWDMVLYIEFQ